jgi:hypothetical protein
MPHDSDFEAMEKWIAENPRLAEESMRTAQSAHDAGSPFAAAPGPGPEVTIPTDPPSDGRASDDWSRTENDSDTELLRRIEQAMQQIIDRLDQMLTGV